MIFVTVGNHNQSFDRLLRWIDHLAAQRLFQETFLVQSGHSNFELNFCESVEFLSMEEFEESIRISRAVVSHSAPGSIMSSLKNGKKPIVVPRLQKFREHLDDHQLHFAIELGNKGLIYLANSEEEIAECLKTALTKNSEIVTYEKSNHKMLSIIEEYLGKLASGV